MDSPKKWPVFNDTMIKNVVNVLESGKVNQWTGTKVKEFEKKFSDYFGVKHAIALMNGSVAIELCLIALNLQKGDEVIVTSRTFIASASSIVIIGGIPVFADVDCASQNITLETIKQKITKKTKGVILVHLGGWPCDLEEICGFCKKIGLWVIEDCAQSHGAKYNDKYAGSFGDMAAWSFCQDKIITTGGEGGMVTTDNTDLFKLAWSYKDHGKAYDKVNNTLATQSYAFRWLHDTIGTNWRMTEMQASIGIDALDSLEDWINHRQQIANVYNNTLKNIKEVRVTIPPHHIKHAYYKYYFFLNPIFFKANARSEIIRDLNGKNINCFVGSCSEVYLEKALSDFECSKLPNASELGETAIMLLCDPTITIQEARDNIEIIQQVIKTYSCN